MISHDWVVDFGVLSVHEQEGNLQSIMEHTLKADSIEATGMKPKIE